MFTLAFETTSMPAGVAILSGEDLLEERRLDRGTKHGVGLLPAAQALIQAHTQGPSDISLVAVSLGPGSFTGIRIGISAARTFARFAGARIVGVPTLDALADEAPSGHERMAVALDAGRGRAYGAIFDLRSGSPEPEMRPAVLPIEELAGRIRGPAWVVGDVPLRHPGLFEGEGRVLAPEDCYPPRPSTIARLALRRAAGPARDGEGSLEPIYLHPPHAKTTREREEARIAKGTPPG